MRRWLLIFCATSNQVVSTYNVIAEKLIDNNCIAGVQGTLNSPFQKMVPTDEKWICAGGDGHISAHGGQSQQTGIAS